MSSKDNNPWDPVQVISAYTQANPGEPHPCQLVTECFLRKEKFLILVTNKPPPGCDQEGAIEVGWLGNMSRSDTEFEFDPTYDRAPDVDADDKRSARVNLASRLVNIAFPKMLEISGPIDPQLYSAPREKRREHEYVPSYQWPCLAHSESFFDTSKLQLVTRNGKLDVIKGRHLGPCPVEPILPAEMRALGFHDFDKTPSFQAIDVRLTSVYGEPMLRGSNSSRWYNVTGGGVPGEQGGVICVMAPSYNQHFMEEYFKPDLEQLASIRNAGLDAEARIVPLEGR